MRNQNLGETPMEEIIDIEAFAKEGKTPPKGKKYKIKVDTSVYTVEGSLTGEQILATAGKAPTNKFQLNQKLRGGVVKKVEYGEVVDFTVPGIERFMTIPLDQTEG